MFTEVLVRDKRSSMEVADTATLENLSTQALPNSRGHCRTESPCAHWWLSGVDLLLCLLSLVCVVRSLCYVGCGVCVVRSLRYVGWWLCFSACTLRRKVVCLVCLSALFGTEMKIEEEAEGTVA